MKTIVYLTIFATIVFSACKKDEKHPAPSACFTVDKIETTDITHTFNFTNCSNNYGTSSWNFGDGHSSDDENPSHLFNAIGAYTVTLTVTNSEGATSTNTRTITLGHNTLTKIIYTGFIDTVSFAKHAIWTCYNPSGTQYFSDDIISSNSDIPFTVTFTEGPLHDVHSSLYYSFSEYHSSTNSYTTPYFNISDLEISDGRLDKYFAYGSDTAKVSLYFKIVPR